MPGLDAVTQFLTTSISQVVGTIESGSYLGIILLMAVESSFIPFPSEIIMIPAGFLAFQGKMNFGLVVASGILGSLLGSLINYYLALFCGRPLLEKYGRYFFIKPQALQKVDNMFHHYGDVVTFTARLIPGVRQLISIPAGLSRMNLPKFVFYTGLGAGLWVLVLTIFGYWIGSQELVWQEAWQNYSKAIVLACFGIGGLALTGIVWRRRKHSKNIALS